MYEIGGTPFRSCQAPFTGLTLTDAGRRTSASHRIFVDLTPMENALFWTVFFKSTDGASWRQRKAQGLPEGDEQGIDPGFDCGRKDPVKRPEGFVGRTCFQGSPPVQDPVDVDVDAQSRSSEPRRQNQVRRFEPDARKGKELWKPGWNQSVVLLEK